MDSAGQTEAHEPVNECDHHALLTSLVHAYRTPIFRFIQQQIHHVWDAEDLTQQAFFEALRGFDRFRGESQYSTWLYGIAQNLVWNYMSRDRRRRLKWDSDECLNQLACERPDPMAQRALTQMLTILQREIDLLPPKLSMPLMLASLDECSYEEIAESLEIPLGTVRSRISRARTSLRKSLDQEQDALLV
jgi:RNA polymerase sigma factor (sigma-70 family)